MSWFRFFHNLGLVTYDDSDGGQSNSESEDESDTEKGDDGDSETELRVNEMKNLNCFICKQNSQQICF